MYGMSEKKFKTSKMLQGRSENPLKECQHIPLKQTTQSFLAPLRIEHTPGG